MTDKEVLSKAIVELQEVVYNSYDMEDSDIEVYENLISKLKEIRDRPKKVFISRYHDHRVGGNNKILLGVFDTLEKAQMAQMEHHYSYHPNWAFVPDNHNIEEVEINKLVEE